VTSAGRLPFWTLFVICVLGGALGGLLLLKTTSAMLAHLVPWLVLFATAVFACGSFSRQLSKVPKHPGPVNVAVAQFMIAIYGGYFGGSIGFLMMTALIMAGLPTRNARATKNVLAGVTNAFGFGAVRDLATKCIGTKRSLWALELLSGLLGSWALHRDNETSLRIAIVCIGTALTIGLFIKPI
jgi:uncharacterized membrane protein YfcA